MMYIYLTNINNNRELQMEARHRTVEERASRVAMWAVETGRWTMQTASEFVRRTQTEEQVKWWEQGMERQS